jgi:proteasome assembly chaperone (PAC2) family protein
MGSVATIAAQYLIQQLAMKEVAELPSAAHFDVSEVAVKGGLVGPARLPRGMFFRWDNPGAGRDLIVFLAEAQPSTGAYAYANELLDVAGQMGVERVVTFASMASALHPAGAPKVTAVATQPEVLLELQRVEARPLEDGQIGGLNGVLLGVASKRGMAGMCLLAEIPFFAASVPNPKAARAALSVFSLLAGLDISLEELGKYAAAVDRALIEALEKMREHAQHARATEAGVEEEEEGTRPEGPQPRPETAPEPDFATRERIERLFEEARRDRGRAMELKQELDRLNLFSRYEDRFLDLFRRAE